MSQLTKYAFANAKIRAMLSRLLEPQFFDAFMAARTVGEALDLLKKTPYEAVVGRVDRDAPDIHRLEEGFAAFDEDIFRKVSAMLHPPEKQFVLLLLEKSEIEALKVALRIWHRKVRVDPEEYLPGRTILYPVDYRRVIAAKSIEELIVLLAETPFFRALARGRERFQEKNSLFYLEAALDIDYYERVLATVGTFSPSDREMARRVLGIEIDIENINWLVRLRKYYDLALGDMLEWFIPGGQRVTKDTLRKSYATDGLSNILESVSVGPYAVIKGVPEQNLQFIENVLYEVLFRQVKRALAGFPFSIGTVLGYLLLKRRETRNIVSIVNAKRLGWKKDALASVIRI